MSQVAIDQLKKRGLTEEQSRKIIDLAASSTIAGMPVDPVWLADFAIKESRSAQTTEDLQAMFKELVKQAEPPPRRSWPVDKGRGKSRRERRAKR